MDKTKAVSFLWSFLISFLLSLSAAMWVVTAFDLGIDRALLTVFCGLAAFFCSLCYSLPLGAVPLAAGGLALILLWENGTLELSAEAILNRLSRQYNKAYNWGIIRWGLRTADDMEPTIITVLCIFAAITAMAAAWSVCRRKGAALPLLSLLFAGCCFVVNDTVPDTVWIFLLLLTAVLLLLTSPVRRQDADAGNRLCLILTPVAALGLVVLLGAVPRQGYDKQATAQKLTDTIFGSDSMQFLMSSVESAGNAIGITDSDRVDLTTVGYRIASDSTVMAVNAPFTDTLYLRGRAMDTYDGTGWTSGGIDDLPWPGAELQDAGEVVITTRFAHRMLYVPYYSNYSGLTDVAAGAVNDKNLTEYSFRCYRLPANTTPQQQSKQNASLLVGYGSVTLNDFIRLDENVKQWAEPLTQEITKGAGSFAEKAERIASYVRNSATYDLETARMPGKEKDFARWFLEKSDTGYCVHFATATTVLLQAAGIPARYVTGYLVTTKAGETVEIPSKQSHAWAEYYLPGFGWTVLEATPADTTQPVTQPSLGAAQPTEVSTPADTEATQQTQPTAPVSGETEDPERQPVLTVMLWIAGVTALLAAAAAQRCIRLGLRRKRYQAASPNDRALICWQETVALALRTGRQPDRQLLETAQLAKFSQHTVTDAQLQQFAHFRAEAVAQLKKRNLFLQLYYRLILVLY